MLARSYQLTGDKISASIAFDKALKIRDDDIDIIQEYIYLLKDLDPKRNKNKITKLFDKIITSNSNNINTYNMLLNYLEFSVPNIDNFKYSEDLIKNHVIERLLPGGDDVEASTQIIEILERSSKSTWGQSLTDWSHTIGNGFRKLKLNFFNKEDDGMFDMEL